MIITRQSIKFYLYGRKLADGSRSIRMSITWCRHRVLFTLPISVKEDQWDSDAMMARLSIDNKENQFINSLLMEYNGKVKKLFEDAAVEERIPTEEEVIAVCRFSVKKSQPLSFLIGMFFNIQSKERGWVPITARKFNILERELRSAGLKYIGTQA